MTERLLQYIWQFQYFNRAELQTENSELLYIIHPGQYNTNQGPDFLEASIRIENTLLVGSIELHVQSSDWDKHRHRADSNYNNVILHVVWEDDARNPLSSVPTLVLQNRIAKSLLARYDEWMQLQAFIPCATSLTSVNALVWMAWKERLLAERLQRKAESILQSLAVNHHHWEETFWQLLAKNFGMKINAEMFENIAKSLPVTVLAKHKNQLITLEALLLGQAGLLQEAFKEDYPQLLQREYIFQQNKYKLIQPAGQVYFLRMRPAAFPTIRLAQLAMLVHRAVHLFAQIKEAVELKEVLRLLDITANDYWHYHYLLDEPSVYKIKRLGPEMIHNIIINTIVPVLFAYGLYHKEQAVKDKALNWLAGVNAEKNSLIKDWQQLGIAAGHAYDSQALIELKTQYCDSRKCLDCAVGNALLKRSIR